MTYSEYLDSLRELQEQTRIQGELDAEADRFDGFEDVNPWQQYDWHQGYWDCLECSPPPEVLDDTPQ